MTQELTQEQKCEKLRALLDTSIKAVLATRDDMTIEELAKTRMMIQEAIEDIGRKYGVDAETAEARKTRAEAIERLRAFAEDLDKESKAMDYSKEGLGKESEKQLENARMWAERAWRRMRGYFPKGWDKRLDHYLDPGFTYQEPEIHCIAEIIRAAVCEERERCAQIALDAGHVEADVESKLHTGWTAPDLIIYATEKIVAAVRYPCWRPELTPSYSPRDA